jgi:hypothetical protein
MDFIALVLAIGALLAFRALNKRTLALESRLEEARLELAAVRAGLGLDGSGTAAAKDSTPAVAPAASVTPPAETAVPLAPDPSTLQGMSRFRPRPRAHWKSGSGHVGRCGSAASHWPSAAS